MASLFDIIKERIASIPVLSERLLSDSGRIKVSPIIIHQDTPRPAISFMVAPSDPINTLSMSGIDSGMDTFTLTVWANSYNEIWDDNTGLVRLLKGKNENGAWVPALHDWQDASRGIACQCKTVADAFSESNILPGSDRIVYTAVMTFAIWR